jgi:hypothetical protein
MLTKTVAVTRAGLVFSCLLASTLATGCLEHGEPNDDVTERNAKIVENLLEAGFSPQDIELRESEPAAINVDGELQLGAPQMQVFVDGDVHVTLDASRELLGRGGGSFRHWRTPNIVNNNTMICLAAVTTADGQYTSHALTDTMQLGLDHAGQNLADLSSFGLSFKIVSASLSSNGTLSHSNNDCDYSIFVYEVPGNAGGSSGFPSGGSPYTQVRLNSGLASYSLDAHEHVTIHEIGHAIGLRHTDWLTRSSCGENTSEGQHGASQISGTPDQTADSVMAACFSANTDGEFRGDDQRALEELY